jgi:hypothetical protein
VLNNSSNAFFRFRSAPAHRQGIRVIIASGTTARHDILNHDILRHYIGRQRATDVRLTIGAHLIPPSVRDERDKFPCGCDVRRSAIQRRRL